MSVGWTSMQSAATKGKETSSKEQQNGGTEPQNSIVCLSETTRCRLTEEKNNWHLECWSWCSEALLPTVLARQERTEAAWPNQSIKEKARGCRLPHVWFDPWEPPARFEISCSVEPTKSVPGSLQFEQDALFGKHNCTGVVSVEAEGKLFDQFCSKWHYDECKETCVEWLQVKNPALWIESGGTGGGS